MQPHPARPAIGMIARALVIKDIDRDDGTGLRGGMKRGLIRHAQIAPQPDDLGFGHCLDFPLPFKGEAGWGCTALAARVEHPPPAPPSREGSLDLERA